MHERQYIELISAIIQQVSKVVYRTLIVKDKARQHNRRTKQHNTTRPKQSFFKEKIGCLGWETHDTVNKVDQGSVDVTRVMSLEEMDQ